MNLDWLATRGGQLFVCLILAVMILFAFGSPDKDTSGKLLFLIIGAVLRDMQDSKSIPNAPAPQGQKEQ